MPLNMDNKKRYDVLARRFKGKIVVRAAQATRIFYFFEFFEF